MPGPGNMRVWVFLISLSVRVLYFIRNNRHTFWYDGKPKRKKEDNHRVIHSSGRYILSVFQEKISFSL